MTYIFENSLKRKGDDDIQYHSKGRRINEDEDEEDEDIDNIIKVGEDDISSISNIDEEDEDIDNIIKVGEDDISYISNIDEDDI